MHSVLERSNFSVAQIDLVYSRRREHKILTKRRSFVLFYYRFIERIWINYQCSMRRGDNSIIYNIQTFNVVKII